MARTTRSTKDGRGVRDGRTTSRREQAQRQREARAGRAKIRQRVRRAAAALRSDPEADVVLPVIDNPVLAYETGAT